MKKKPLIKIFFICLFSFYLFTHCDMDLLDPISFKVVASGGGFDGYYIADGGEAKNFNGGILIGGFSNYEEEVEIKENLQVFAITRMGASSVAIRIFRSDKNVKETLKEGITEPTNLSLSYQYNEENQPQKEGTTTSTQPN